MRGGSSGSGRLKPAGRGTRLLYFMFGVFSFGPDSLIMDRFFERKEAQRKIKYFSKKT